MKRFFILLLSLTFFPVLSAFASENPYVGIWVFDRPSGLNSKTIITYQIDEKDRVFYSSQEFFYDGSPAVIDSKVLSCEYDDKKIAIKDGDFIFKELYYVDSVRLSADKRKTYNFYHRVLGSTAEYESALALSNLKKPNLDPVGRWSFSASYSTMEDNYLLAKTDFFIFPDGSVYRVSVTKKKNDNDLTIGHDYGIWIGDKDDMTIRVGKNTYKAYIDDEGFLYVVTDENTPVQFFRITKP